MRMPARERCRVSERPRRLGYDPPLMPNRLASEQSPYLLQHKDNPVDWYAWGEAAFGRARREDKPIFLSGRLLDLSLVPRDGARKLRRRRRGGRAQSPLRVDQGRPRRAAGRRSRIHDLCTGHDRSRRVADERLADAGARAVLRRHLFPALVAMGPAGVRRHPRGGGAGLARRARQGAAVGGDDGRSAARVRCAPRRDGRPGSGGAGRRGRGIRERVRSAARRVRGARRSFRARASCCCCCASTRAPGRSRRRRWRYSR